MQPQFWRQVAHIYAGADQRKVLIKGANDKS